MNERIKELFKRAGGKTSVHNLMSNPMQQREYSELWNENIQKFAELIVQDCADHALTFNNNLQSLNDKEIRSHSNRVSDYIKDRMGVEQ